MYKVGILVIALAILFSLTVLPEKVQAENVPEWVKNTAKWYGEGTISEADFLNAIKFLIENKIIEIDLQKVDEDKLEQKIATIIIPNGNANQSNTGFYIPLNLEIEKGTTVQWVNDDNFPHTVQSQDEFGKVIAIFNSPVLQTGETFEHTFDDSATYNYFCTLHPWRVGIVTVQ